MVYHFIFQPEFEDFVRFMTSGLSYILVIAPGNERQPPWEETEANPETEPKEPSEDQEETATAMKTKWERQLETRKCTTDNMLVGNEVQDPIITLRSKYLKI